MEITIRLILSHFFRFADDSFKILIQIDIFFDLLTISGLAQSKAEWMRAIYQVFRVNEVV